MREPESGHSWTSKVFNTVISLDTYQFVVDAEIGASDKDLPVNRANKYKHIIKSRPCKHRLSGFCNNSLKEH